MLHEFLEFSERVKFYLYVKKLNLIATWTVLI